MDAQHAVLIVNPLARAGRSGAARALMHLQERGLGVAVVEIHEPGEIPDTVASRCDQADIIIVGGGDGTLNAAAPALLACGRPIGILPLGTANDLARTLMIPRDTGAASDVIADGIPHRIDLGRVNDVYFFNVASIGVSARVARHIDPRAKQRLGPLAYARKAATELRRQQPFAARIRSATEQLRVRSIQIAVGNGRYYGGGTPVAAEAEIDDRELFLYSIPPHPWWRLATLLPHLKRGTHGKSRHLLLMHGREFTIETSAPMPISTDGELTTWTPAHFEVLPQALTVIVPRAYLTRRSATRVTH